MALAATAPPLLLKGDAVEVMPKPWPGARGPLPVVTTTVGAVALPFRAACASCTASAKRQPGRAVAWVSAEGVGVAPAMPPTLGDRHASRHRSSAWPC